jgi:hypothetical protein
MVKSNTTAMPKRRKIQVDPELLKELEDLERRMRQTDREIEAVIARAHEVQQKLRAMYSASR